MSQRVPFVTGDSVTAALVTSFFATYNMARDQVCGPVSRRLWECVSGKCLLNARCKCCGRGRVVVVGSLLAVHGSREHKKYYWFPNVSG